MATFYVDPESQVADGTAFTPSGLDSHGKAYAAGTIYTTCSAAYNASSGDGNTFRCRRGRFHDPVGGVFFIALFQRSTTLFSDYGPLTDFPPILDGGIYMN
ncbi:MAG: hypothetical protein ACREIB_11470, partial [Pseudomonadota bacterium]